MKQVLIPLISGLCYYQVEAFVLHGEQRLNPFDFRALLLRAKNLHLFPQILS